MRGGPRRSGLLLNLFACFLIPAYTLLFAGSRAWFSTNFSVIAVTGPDHYRGFLYWGVLAGGYFFLMLMKLASILRSRVAQTAAILLTLAACLSLCYALAIPYLPEQFPRYADLHVILAALACVLLMLALLVALLALYRRQPGLVYYRRHLRGPVSHPPDGLLGAGGVFHHLRRPARPQGLAVPPIVIGISIRFLSSFNLFPMDFSPALAYAGIRKRKSSHITLEGILDGI